MAQMQWHEADNLTQICTCRLMAVANSKAPASGKPAPPKQLLPFIAHMAKTEGLGAFYQVQLPRLLDRPMSLAAD